jgi:hypothetical protein
MGQRIQSHLREEVCARGGGGTRRGTTPHKPSKKDGDCEGFATKVRVVAWPGPSKARDWGSIGATQLSGGQGPDWLRRAPLLPYDWDCLGMVFWW